MDAEPTSPKIAALQAEIEFLSELELALHRLRIDTLKRIDNLRVAIVKEKAKK